jgi:hypothetical protein
MDRTNIKAAVAVLDNEAHDARVYTQANITKLIEMDAKTFQTNMSRGVFPNAPTTSGTGDWRRYSLNHAIGFSALVALIKLGMPPRLVQSLSHSIDLAVQASSGPRWVVIRRDSNCDLHLEHEDQSGAWCDGLLNWIGGDGYEAVAVPDDTLAQAVAEAGNGAIVLHWADIRRRILANALKMSQEQPDAH